MNALLEGGRLFLRELRQHGQAGPDGFGLGGAARFSEAEKADKSGLSLVVSSVFPSVLPSGVPPASATPMYSASSRSVTFWLWTSETRMLPWPVTTFTTPKTRSAPPYRGISQSFQS